METRLFQYLLFSARFARAMHQRLVHLHTLHEQFVQTTKNTGLHEAPDEQQVKEYYGILRWCWKRRLRVDGRAAKTETKISVFKNIWRCARVDGDYALLDKFKQITVFANPSTELVPLYRRSIRIRDKLFLA